MAARAMASQKAKRAGGSNNDSIQDSSFQKPSYQKISAQYAFQILEKRIMDLESNNNLNANNNENQINYTIDQLQQQVKSLEGLINKHIKENSEIKKTIETQKKTIESLSEIQPLVNKLSIKFLNNDE